MIRSGTPPAGTLDGSHRPSEVDISTLTLGVIGAGGMGSNHARVVAESEHADLAVVVDRDFPRARELAERYGCRAAKTIEDLRDCDAVIVATSTSSHIDIALQLLSWNLPLLVEKPAAETAQQVEAILVASRRARVPIMCGFVERFNPALTTALSLLDAPVVQLSAVRHSPQNPLAGSSVVHDLLIHDIDVALRAASAVDVPRVTSGTWCPKPGTKSEIAECLIQFSDGMLANLSASRWGQRKIRQVRIATEQQLIEVDLLRVNVEVYRNISQSMIGTYGGSYRAETIVDVPYVRHRGEPLAMQLAAFVDLIRSDDPDRAERERGTILPPHIVAAQVEQQ